MSTEILSHIFYKPNSNMARLGHLLNENQLIGFTDDNMGIEGGKVYV